MRRVPIPKLSISQMRAVLDDQHLWPKVIPVVDTETGEVRLYLKPIERRTDQDNRGRAAR